MIKICPVGNRIKTSPLTKEFGTKYLKSQGIIISTLSEAELIIAASWKGVLPLMFMYGKRKKFMIVTHEPRFDTHFDLILKYPLLPEVKVLNVYTGIYNNNYMYGPKQVNLTPLTNFEFKNHKVVALMGYRKNPRKWSLKYKGKELDLCYLRTQIALEGHKMNILDLYGKDWPKDIKKGQSRGRNWWNKKQAILQEYDFNLAFENTNWPYYCTEKIW
ncbi:MAG: hypothetical protein F6K39_18815, partial [Okeania sp. SIO3B3]|nr:hypothetical protein [Okeania sp. SIO3B3]